jgi:hypothetical protein
LLSIDPLEEGTPEIVNCVFDAIEVTYWLATAAEALLVTIPTTRPEVIAVGALVALAERVQLPAT